MSTYYHKRGFTIIEVVLVLAIAGLIFLMVFLALPALQRSQKDTQRRDQLSSLVTQITQYQANNRNKLPSCASGTACLVVVSESDGKINSTSSTSGGGWITFYQNYLMAQGDVFEDPNGVPYNLQITACNPDIAKDGTKCAVQRSSMAFSGGNSPTSGTSKGSSEEAESAENTEETDDNKDAPVTTQNYYVLITTNSNCDGEDIVYNSGARRVSVAYRLEGGGTYCSNN